MQHFSEDETDKESFVLIHFWPYTGWAKSHIGLLTFKIFFIVVVIIMKFQHNINKSQEIYLGNFNKRTK